MSASFSQHKTQAVGIAFTRMLTAQNLFNFFDSLFQVVHIYISVFKSLLFLTEI